MFARIVRVIVSLAISILPLLYIAGYLSFIPGLPSPSTLFGFGSSGSQSSGGISNLLGVGSGFESLVPIGAFGVSGLIIFSILSRIGTTVSSAVSRPSTPNLQSILGPAGLMGPMGALRGVPDPLPQDITKSQYIMLSQFRGGQRKSGEIAKSLNMDKSEVERGIFALKNNGYLSSDNKLTSKGFDVLS